MTRVHVIMTTITDKRRRQARDLLAPLAAVYENEAHRVSGRVVIVLSDGGLPRARKAGPVSGRAQAGRRRQSWDGIPR